jgi:lambda family phage portal protein
MVNREVGQFAYAPGPVGRTLDRWFPRRGQANRQAALRNWLFDRSVQDFAASYDAIDRSRLRKKRTASSGSGDVHLTEQALSDLREACRDLARNNPIVKGLLKTEANSVVGRSTRIEVKSSDKKFNKDAEDLWRERVVERPCEVTGRFGFHKVLRTIFQSYRQDGDIFVLFTPSGIQIAEGEQCGTPHGLPTADRFDVTNGVATRKYDDQDGPAGSVVGYYIGKPDRWGFIRPEDYTKYEAQDVCHVFNSDRFSYTRGEPALTSAVDWIDKVTRYADATLVAAHVQACYSIFIKKQSPEGSLPTPTPSGASSDTSEAGHRNYKLEPGMIWEGEPGDEAEALSSTQPNSVFDAYILRCLSFIGRPLCFPLPYISGDFSGATYMNMRFALDMARDNHMQEQDEVLVPFLHRWHRWQMEQWIRTELKKAPADWDRRLIRCKRWPYIDRLKDAQADILLMQNLLKSHRRVMSDRGDDFEEEVADMAEDRKILVSKGLLAASPDPAGGGEDGPEGDREEQENPDEEREDRDE